MYLWIKAFHLIAMIAWFAGLFYIFRLFVYHVKYKNEPKLCEVYQVMEYKLLYVIMHPAMTVTLICGIWMLILNPALLQMHWLHAKLALVIALMAYQFFCGLTRRRFAKGDFFLSEKQCRMINEVPTLILIAVVILVIVRPL